MGTSVSNIIIIAIIVVILFFAVKNSIPHFKGQGSCCGGGSASKRIKPKKLTTVVANKRIRIDGMVCDNCAARVANALNSLEAVNAKVNRSRREAVVKLGKNIDDDELKATVEDLGYKVVEII